MQVSPQKSEGKKSEWNSLEDKSVEPKPSLENYESVCDIWKDCVTKSIRKLESQTPVYLQTYLQVHNEYLHGIDNLFGTCYLWQRQYFDRLAIGKSTVNEYGKFCQVVMDEIGNWMDSALNIRKLRSDMLIELMKTSNQMIQQGIDWHAKWMTSLNSFFVPQTKS